MALVEFRGVSYEIAGKPILLDLSLRIEAGETLVLLGRSGSGKTTALKMINGMLFPTRGQIFVAGKPTTEWDPIRLRRRMGYVIQEVGLFPHFTVGDNVALVPKLEGWSAPDIETLRDSGVESPSGRLVVDMSRLREKRALSSGSNEIKVLGANTTENTPVGAPSSDEPPQPSSFLDKVKRILGI